MSSRFLGLVGTLPPPELCLCFPNLDVQDSCQIQTLSHLSSSNVNMTTLLIRLHMYRAGQQESCTVEDPQDPPSDWQSPKFCHPLQTSTRLLYTFRIFLSRGNNDLLSPSQHTLSRQIMKHWQTWRVIIETSNNTRMIERLDFHVQ